MNEQQVAKEKCNDFEQSSDIEQMDAEPVDIEQRLEKAHSVTKKYVLGSMGIGLVPVPLVDIAGITLVQLKMIHSLSNLYGIKFSNDLGKSLISSLTGGVATASVGLTLGSWAKVVPVIGSLLGATSVSLVAGGTTYAISKVFIQHFESGGTFLDLNPESVREYFKEEFEKGKQYAGNLKQPANKAA